MTIKDIFKDKKEKQIEISAWVISIRGNDNIRFITVNDGSTFKNLQIVVKGEQSKESNNIRVGASINFSGNIKLTPKGKQELEVVSEKIKLLKNSDKDFPIQKQKMSKEFLREIPHIRHRTNLFRSIMRIRSTLFQEIHSFFSKEGFLNITSPIITSNDGEGAGESFVLDDESKTMFFDKKAKLGVTGQLHAESYANGFGNVYTFGPTFRAEKSHTKKHIAEFWMLEPEMAFYDIEDAISLIERLLKQVIKKTMEKNAEEFNFLNDFLDKNIKENLDKFLAKGIQKIDYVDAITELQKNKDLFEEKDIKFGMDLSTEHEKFISSKIFNGPVAVLNYPKEIKAFYMKQNDDNKTVAAFDILVPEIGELIGGSERETNYDKLIKRVEELKIPKKDVQWYLDLRRWGQSKSTGFGLGFERLLMYVTGIENIRDSIPFPRTPNNLKM